MVMLAGDYFTIIKLSNARSGAILGTPGAGTAFEECIVGAVSGGFLIAHMCSQM